MNKGTYLLEHTCAVACYPQDGSDVMAGQPTEHNRALSAALELFVTQELNKCYFLTGYNDGYTVQCISSTSKGQTDRKC